MRFSHATLIGLLSASTVTACGGEDSAQNTNADASGGSSAEAPPVSSGAGAAQPGAAAQPGGPAAAGDPATPAAPPAAAGAAPAENTTVGVPSTVPAAGAEPSAGDSAGAVPGGVAAAEPAAAAPDGTPTAGNAATEATVAGSEPGTTGVAAPSEQPAVASGDCTISIDSSEISEAIATVGIVTFSTDLSNVGSARIEFGLDTNYTMTAPVDLSEPGYRTLLLGMKQSREYNYRIVVESDGAECASANQLIETGPLPNILPTLQVNNIEPDKLQGGFVSTGQYQARGGSSSPAYIIDSDGDYVWALAIGDYVTGVRQSYDGKYMWINGTDNTTGGQANIFRVTMDGMVVEDMSQIFGQQDHSITVLPNETVVFYGHDATQCANIRQRFADGTIEPIINSGDAHMAPGACHVNAIEYSPMDDTLIFSDDNHDNYTKITRDGEVVWVLGGSTSHFTGDASQWIREHGIDVLAKDRILIFNNNEPQDPRGSVATEILLDLDNMTATKVWEYQAEPTISNQVLGDVQRMENGNTVIAYSAQGLMHEVDKDGKLLQEIVWPLGGAFGYIVKRQSLYGPPPR